MQIETWYKTNWEARLQGRYITLETIDPILQTVHENVNLRVVGSSEMGRDIHLLKIGTGSSKVLAWSQMHGNESTTTKAVFDFIKLLSQPGALKTEANRLLRTHTFYIIPMLNPDGAKLYTRENANEVDLNRDALNLSQKESRVLRKIFEEIQPNLCLNLHDQRSIYGLQNGNPAVLSFLAPAADKACRVTRSRKEAMNFIVAINKTLQKYIPNQVGRYDDTFNENCVGDSFQKAGVPTILFEAGHYPNDYEREHSRKLIFYSLLALFGIIESNNSADYTDYFKIPENEKTYVDILLRNAQLPNEKVAKNISIMFQETLKDNSIQFVPTLHAVNSKKALHGHQEKDLKGASVLINSQEKYHIGQKVLLINNKKDRSTEYFTFV